tara:strand:+ start:9589 stop:10026 length:438 start_codon:yes stop_codon:yes gene_type:complete
MQSFGEYIGGLLRGGEVIELVGDVGAGKTTLVRGIARGFGIGETIQSPSFTISRVYDARDGLWLTHYDFYRLEQPGIMADELADTLQDNKTVTILEWGETVKNILPIDRLTITITPEGETSRYLRLHSSGHFSKELEGRLHDFTA